MELIDASNDLSESHLKKEDENTKYNASLEETLVFMRNDTKIDIVNVMASFVTCKPDLKEIALRARNSNYNPKRFPAVTVRFQDPRSTSLIFASGKVVITGCKGEAHVNIAAKRTVKLLKKLGHHNVYCNELKIHNIVASHCIPFRINMEKFAFHFRDLFYKFHYEPELFPGSTMLIPNFGVTVLTFGSGKMVLTGGKTLENIQDTMNYMNYLTINSRHLIERP